MIPTYVNALPHPHLQTRIEAPARCAAASRHHAGPDQGGRSGAFLSQTATGRDAWALALWEARLSAQKQIAPRNQERAGRT